VLVTGQSSQHVGIESWRGSTLPDSERLLEGTGKNLCHVKVRTPDGAQSRSLAKLIRAAVELDRKEPKRRP
jgi:hypothetical protein